jgi:TolB protein
MQRLGFFCAGKRQDISKKHLRLVLAFLLFVACQGRSNPGHTPSLTAAVSPAAGENVGQLAYIGLDGNVYVTTADASWRVAVTTDATAPPERLGRSYHRVSWSPDGWLAFAAVTRSLQNIRSTLYVIQSPQETPTLVGESEAHFVIYIYWSPVTCPERPSCRRLAYLIQEGADIGLRQVTIDADGADNRLLDTGRPFYFSWAPDGRSMVWHTGGARAADSDPRLALFDVIGDSIAPLADAPGAFVAPAWSPLGGEWLAVSVEGGADKLQRFRPDHPPDPVAASHGEWVFAWSPSGDRIAYSQRIDVLGQEYGPIFVRAFENGTSTQLTRDGFNIRGFFWAPQGDRIAYLTGLDVGDQDWMQWRTYNLITGQDRGFAVFHPSPHMRYVVTTFNQYAQSHRLWSPDGRYLVYAERDPAQVDRIWLVDTYAQRGAAPLPVAEGTIGFWSWH